jgi:hypothetical protein
MMARLPSAIAICLRPLLVAGCICSGAGSVLGDEATAPAPDAAAEEQAFLRVRPLPEGFEKVQPIPGAQNVRFVECEAAWPQEYKENRSKIGSAEFRANSDIYAYLNAQQSFEMRDCSCTGKVAPWANVDVIYAALLAEHGELSSQDTAEFSEAADRLEGAVATLCGGKF